MAHYTVKFEVTMFDHTSPEEAVVSTLALLRNKEVDLDFTVTDEDSGAVTAITVKEAAE